MIIRGSIQSFKDSDLLKLVDPLVLENIRKTDPHPLFKKYSVAHEGISKPRVIGKGTTEISWGRKAIQSVSNAIAMGIQCIAGHTQDNIKRGEKVVAQIVGKGEELINNLLNAVVIGYFPNKDDADYDVISMEADLNWSENGYGLGIAEGITALSRFALGKSENDIPAFQDAKLLASIQCFDEKESPSELGKGKKMDLTTAPFGDIVAEIKRRQTFPSQIFSRDEIIGEPVTEANGQISFRGGDAQITSYLLKKLPSPEDVRKESQAKIIELETKVKELEPKVSELSSIKLENARFTAKEDILSYAKTKKLTEKQTKWIEENLDKYSPSDNKEESIKTFVDAQTEDFKRIQKLFPVSAENPPTKDSEASPETTEFEIKHEMY
jgi:hypothetical protein